jgi:hypothetical protein
MRQGRNTAKTVLGRFLNVDLTIQAIRKKSKVTGQYERDVFIVAPKISGIRSVALSRGNIDQVTDVMLVDKLKRFHSDRFAEAGGVLWLV